MGRISLVVFAVFIFISSNVFAQAEPKIESLNVTAVRPGGSIEIRGANLSQVNSVQFNGVEAASFKIISKNLIEAVLPAGATSGYITVSAENGISRSQRELKVGPSILGFFPAQAEPGSKVTLNGLNLSGVKVLLVGKKIARFKILSDTQIEFVVPKKAKNSAITLRASGLATSSTTPLTVSGSASTQTPPPQSWVPPQAPSNSGMNIGINLSSISFYDQESLYTDVTNLTGGWWEDNTGLVENQIVPLTFTSDNYPLTDAQNHTDMPGCPAGVYMASWDHDENTNVILNPGYQAPRIVSQSDTVIGSGLHHTVMYIQIPAETPMAIHVRRVNPSNPNIVLRNFHIIAPELDSNGNVTYDYGPFTSRFLNKLAPFSVIRFMDFFNTNDDKDNPSDCPAVNWSDRTTPEMFGRFAPKYPGLGRQGGTYEEAIELANITGKDIWINVPDCATDDYINHMAQLFAANLNPRSKLYVEFSNEVWNTGFGQWYHIVRLAAANPELTSTDSIGRPMQQVAYEAVKIGSAFRAAFGSRSNQVKTVLAGKGEDVWTIQVGLDFINEKFGEPSKFVDFISGAPAYSALYDAEQAKIQPASLAYWNAKQQYLKTKSPSDEVAMNSALANALDIIFQGMHDYNTKYVSKWLQDGFNLSQQYGIPYIGYEGGQSLTSFWYVLKNQTVIQEDGTVKTGQNAYPLFDPMYAAQNDPRMADIYKELFGMWLQIFGDALFCHYSLATAGNNFGFWGLLTDINQTGSVKWDFLMSLIEPH